MSPEQAEGKLDQLSPATDVYSLGATLHCLLTDASPMTGNDLFEVLEKVRSSEVAPARNVRPDVPRPLEAVCDKAMMLRPADRYPSALALAAEVERLLADEAVNCLAEPVTV
jgi:serine/threonine protein kinase